MSEYEECLYSYIMENKYRELWERTDYIVLRTVQKRAEKALEETLTEEQQALFREYLDQETAAYSLELRHLFCLTLSMGNQLSRL